MAKITKNPRMLPTDEDIISLNCYAHKHIDKDGICLATDCLVRRHNIENYLGECRLYKRLKRPE